MVTVVSGGEWDFALIASVLGNAALIGFAWRQFAEARREARLSRRPVPEAKVIAARLVEIGIANGKGSFDDRVRRTIKVELENVGEGRAVNVRVYGRFDHIESIKAEKDPLTKAQRQTVIDSATHIGDTRNLRPGQNTAVTMDGPDYESDPLADQWASAARAFVTYEDVYGETFWVPNEVSMGFVHKDAAGIPVPPGAVIRKADD